jgi:hypothetical protein
MSEPASESSKQRRSPAKPALIGAVCTDETAQKDMHR